MQKKLQQKRLSHTSVIHLAVPTRLHTLLIVLVLLIAGCDSNFGASVTPQSMFPTRVTGGSPLPTFADGSIPIQPQPTAPVVIQPTAMPTLPPPTVAPPPTPVPTLDNNWITIANGIQYRQLFFNTSQGFGVGILVARIDPARATFRVVYSPGVGRTIQQWVAQIPTAKVIVNGGYFTTGNLPIGLIATDSFMSGALTRRNDSGLFQVKGGVPKVRFLYLEPYAAGERLEQAVEGFPILVAGGEAAPAFNPDISNLPSSRTVIAQDTRGRILIIVTSPGVTSFTDMAYWLANSGLEIDTALNLDGGGSTSLFLATGGPAQYTPGVSPVPVVLAVFPR